MLGSLAFPPHTRLCPSVNTAPFCQCSCLTSGAQHSEAHARTRFWLRRKRSQLLSAVTVT